MENEFPRGQLNPTILSTLLEKDKYGYEIIEEIKSKTGIEVKQPSLYSSLKRMETQKYISSYWQDSDLGGKRHYYCLTDLGKQFLSKNPVDPSLFKNTVSDSVKNNEKPYLEVSNSSPDTEKESKTEQKENEFIQLAQQDNLFNAIKAKSDELEKTEEKSEEKIEKLAEKSDDFVQYDLFANIKKEEPQKKEEFVKTRNLHNKKSGDPYQLKYLSEDDLKNELERIRSQKQDDVTRTTSTLSLSSGQNPQTSQQNNVWLNRNSYINSQNRENLKVNEAIEEAKAVVNEGKEVKEVYFAKETTDKAVKDDGRFITERINPEDIPRQNSTPSTLNIESTNYSSFLNSRIANKESERRVENLDKKDPYQQKSEETFKQTDAPKYDFTASLANLESKFEKYTLNKNNPSSQEPERQFDKVEKVENTYERVKSASPVFNSYKGLESYFNSKGIGFHAYNKKDKSAKHYVDLSLIKLIRGILFSLYSIILAIAFYCGINYASMGKITYIIFPVLALALTTFYGINYHKSKANTIIQVEKSVVTPIILPVISACAILVVIAINLIIGFQHGNALYYFPLLIYPICLSLHIALIIPINKLINFCVLKYRELRDN